MNKKIEDKLSQLPSGPGVYFHKNKAGETIYIGKAAVLRSRVRQYFQKSRYRDPKTDIMVGEIDDIEWIETDSEADALFLEAELVRRYLPPYNILLRDDKSLEFVRIDYKSDHPTVSTVRRPLDDGAEYFGPYVQGYAVKRALKLLRRAFPYATKRLVAQKRTTLHYHLGLDPGLEEGKTSLADYRANLRKLMRYLRGERGQLIKEIERDMKRAAKAQDFEAAARFRNQLGTLQALSRQIIFSDREMLDVSKDKALAQLSQLLNLRTGKAGMPAIIKRLEGFDISHQQGTDNVASMVVFSSGLPDKASYRKFKLRIAGNDDFAHMHEVVSRRLRADNVKKWGLPDVILIDGGKGQLSAAQKARNEAGYSMPMIGLAKREEEIILSNNEWGLPETEKTAVLQELQAFTTQNTEDFSAVLLPKNSEIVKLLQRIRDESHRFAVSYHSSLKRSRQTRSMIDELPGIGPATRKKLIRHYGSLRTAKEAGLDDLSGVIGKAKGRQVHDFLHAATAPAPLKSD